MKEAIGGISIFQIVIVFILLFTGIMCLTINHSKAFSVKDKIINIIENSGLTNIDETSTDVFEEIAKTLNEIGYRSSGICDEDSFGIDRSGKTTDTNASVCIKKVDVSDSLCSNCLTPDEFPEMAYYEVQVFYQLDIPIIKYVGNFKLNGATKILYGS